MRILFVHQNFPGQFVHLAPEMARRGHDVFALTASTNTNPNLSVVSTARYKWEPRTFERSTFGLASTYAEMTYRGETVVRAAITLRDGHGLQPDVIFGTPGWGETLFLKEVWPDARHIMYGEFFYGPRGLDVGFDPEFTKCETSAQVGVRARQAYLLVATNAADRILCPTEWQASSFPQPYHDRISVIHDGIDTDRVCPIENATVSIPGTNLSFKKGDELLTFINRNLERHRGYHVFMRALPKVLAARPKAQVVIIGGDGESYSPRSESGKSWKQIFLDEVRDQLDMSRVHFVGRVPYSTFVDLMRITRVHAYLTYPFVLSWSMLEAMAAGAVVVASRTAPVEEVIEDGVNGRLVPFFDIDRWSNDIIETLAEPQRFALLGLAARQSIVQSYDLRRVCLSKLVEFVEDTSLTHAHGLHDVARQVRAVGLKSATPKVSAS